MSNYTKSEFLDGKVTLYGGDNRDVLRDLPDNSIDSIVTDPPYALVSIVKRFANSPRNERTENTENPYGRTGRGFMGCRWDTGEVAFSEVFWAECLRVLKPGGHVAAFSGTRTYHRMACAIEDAGFEIRDSLMWVYGTGFPKSQNVAKFIDKELGAESVAIGTKTYAGGHVQNNALVPPIGTFARSQDDRLEYAYTTQEAQKYDGFGTALKPAFEPIVLARKPLSEKTVAANVLRWGTGALNIDGCRVSCTDAGGRPKIVSKSEKSLNTFGDGLNGSRADGVTSDGRWPANVVHDGSDEVVGAFPNAGGQQGRAKIGGAKGGSIYGKFAENVSSNPEPRGDSGSAARFFYSAKASRQDRNEGLDSFTARNEPAHRKTNLEETADNPYLRGVTERKNTHPTVKPTALMQWLCRLITPPGGTVLDPFMGSGSTGKGAVYEGFKFIGCEREEEYIKISEARIAYAINNKPHVAAAVAVQPANDNHPRDLFGHAA